MHRRGVIESELAKPGGARGGCMSAPRKSLPQDLIVCLLITLNIAACRSRRSSTGMESAWAMDIANTSGSKGVDEQGRLEFGGGAGETETGSERQVLGVLSGDILFGDKIHPSRNGVTKPARAER